MEKTWVYGHRMRGVNAVAAILNQLRMGRSSFTVDDLMMNTHIDSDDMKNELNILVTDCTLRKLDDEWFAVNGGERTFHEYVLTKSKEASSVSYGIPPEEADLLSLEDIVGKKWTFEESQNGRESSAKASGRGRRRRSSFFDDDEDEVEVKATTLSLTQIKNREIFVSMGYKFEREQEEISAPESEKQPHKPESCDENEDPFCDPFIQTRPRNISPNGRNRRTSTHSNDVAVNSRIAPCYDAWEDEDTLKKAVCDLLVDRIRSYGSSSPWAMRRTVLADKIAYSHSSRISQLYDRLAYELGICRPSEYVELCKLIKNPPAIEDDPDKGRIEKAISLARKKGFLTTLDVCKELRITAAEGVEVVRKMTAYGFVVSSLNGFRYVNPVSEEDVNSFNGASVVTLLVQKYRKSESD